MNKLLRSLLFSGVGAIAILAAVCLFSQTGPAPPTFSVRPLPGNAPRLSTAEAAKIINANLDVIYRVEQVPAAVKEDYTLITHQPFQMVNKGEPVSTDAIIPGVPNKELMLVGVTKQDAVLIYKQYGFFSVVQVMVFSHQEKAGMWTTTISDYSVKDLASLRSALQKGEVRGQ